MTSARTFPNGTNGGTFVQKFRFERCYSILGLLCLTHCNISVKETFPSDFVADSIVSLGFLNLQTRSL